MVLLIVDTQKLITNEKLYKFHEFVVNIESLIDTARKNNIEVIYVRHDDGVENELTKGKNGFEIYEKFKPCDEEKIFDKEVNSAFKGTGLLEYLKSTSEKNIIIAGLQTDYCIDATIKCGFEHGFNIIVPAYANTTVDNSFMSAEQSYKYYNEFIWNERYAECISVDETLRRMK
ncbi:MULTISPECIES: cysteine hydrolase family protein [unclassified Clostridioides]|uniref:cysteine hydrolase family protein n=1 Tax=unclassified Clostridioides TaxID=2635829 RepID=UPI001D0CD33C|nr:cysteine hydrolase [Clostridioides sp. ES-S-0123-01]MCC0670912.1 cysteine hydrolase [Clostridioides sp. ES-S-0145-01]MCC0682045.1 cysteine hydrolase [Clostridioides sp. ES-S-0005-03]MCC0696666.1 cysteine hydrolase [Clostridioides sp. ES-S-0048-02]MCC0706798.1 cysteine hydrolase [Clostridioides sp. ES-S-0190-01]MCC0764549.1 cysteine hydrolase [Clostridioides sp. ES-S-0006-03]UDN47523.1 cysteine hydrolase [Clostridioides sp. ES-S-0173-01]UDN58552.1 cysteine hydrolase [Clostridioides sp. ES-